MASKEVLSALEALHRELEKLQPAIKHVETAQHVTEVVKNIPQKHIDLLEEIIKSDSNFKNGLQKICENEISEISKENKALQKNTGQLQDQVKVSIASMSQLKDIIQSSHEKIEKINFPERLDKLDANVSGIMAATQSVQSRIDSLERNITDRLKDLGDYQKENHANLQSSIDQRKSELQMTIEAAAKRQRILTYVSLGLILIAIVAIFIQKVI